MPNEPFIIRPCLPEDEDQAYEVCLKTGDAGLDATHLYSDPKALGHIFVGPYIHLEPALAFVLEDQHGVCGYVLGALDTLKFFQTYQERWLPELRKKHSKPAGDSSKWTATERVYYEYYHPDVFCPDAFRQYPSHLHIDLLPRAQGKGQGKRMMEVLLKRLKELRSIGVHLGMAASNSRAEHFYKKLGFEDLARVESNGSQVLYLAKSLI